MQKHTFIALAAAAALLLAACGNSSPPGGASQNYPDTVIGADETLQPDGQGKPCQTGVGRIYDVTIPSPLGNGETIGATVFEPALMDCSQKVPLVLYHTGFSTPRIRSLVPIETNPTYLISVYYDLVHAPLHALVAAGYGVITFDPRGIGSSGGGIRIQDPDYEGANAIRVVDWAETNLDWLAYGPSVDGRDPHNLVLGTIGLSYGGGFQNMLLAIDRKKRVDAIQPIITWNDLPYSLAQGGVWKTHWLQALKTSTAPPVVLDPYTREFMDQALSDLQPREDKLDFLRYHSLRYFCDGQPVATNGGPGTAPRLAPDYPPKVHALFIQASRDILFDLNEALANYECLKPNGGDVRLFTIQNGHSMLGLFTLLSGGAVDGGPTDPGIIYQPEPTQLNATCGGVTNVQAQLAFFDEHLKGMSGRVDQVIGQQICLSLTAIDSVKVDAIQRGGTAFPIAADAPGNTVTVGQDESQATTVPLLTVTDVSNVLAGIPKLDVTLTDPDNPDATGGDTIVYIGIGQKHLLGLTPWDLVDNQILALRGLGHHQVEMHGVLERALFGDQLGLMIFGANDNQYPTAALTVHPPHAARVRVQGSVQLPLLGNLPPVVIPGG